MLGGAMGSLALGAIVFALVFVGGAIGLELQRALPESYTTGGARDMTGAVVGLMTLLLALVLGLLIWTAYGVFSTQKSSVQTLAVSGLMSATDRAACPWIASRMRGAMPASMPTVLKRCRQP